MTATPRCAECEILAYAAERARAMRDLSLKTDFDVLLRRHRAAAHPDAGHLPISTE